MICASSAKVFLRSGRFSSASKSDKQFWFNLPANFDLLDACYRQYLWTDDDDYLAGEFLSFYRRTVISYVRRWSVGVGDVVGAGPHDGTRGIGSYNESIGGIRTGADLLASEYRAFRSWASIERALGEITGAAEAEIRAQRLRRLFDRDWWNDKDGRFFFAVGADGHFMHLNPASAGTMLSLPLYFGLVDPGAKTRQMLKLVARCMPLSEANVDSLRDGLETDTYLPDIYYRYGRSAAAYQALIALTDPGLYRRDYPEVSFTVVGNVATGLMGIGVEPSSGDLQTLPQLTGETEWAFIQHVPVRANRISVRHDGNGRTWVRNGSGPPLRWRAGFSLGAGGLMIDGAPANVTESLREGQVPRRYTVAVIPAGEESVVAVG